VALPRAATSDAPEHVSASHRPLPDPPVRLGSGEAADRL
jgi:hypothetical protein